MIGNTPANEFTWERHKTASATDSVTNLNYMGEHSFLFLGAAFPWVYSLAAALAARHTTHVTQFYDWSNYRRLRPTWPKLNGTIPPLHLQNSMRVFPPGYAGRLEWLFRPVLQRVITQWCEQLSKVTGDHPWVVASYPYLVPWMSRLPEDKLIYFNFDDYVLYWPHRAEDIRKQEDELIERAVMTLCSSQFQTEAFRERHPRKAASIHHYPHGVVEAYLNPDVETTTPPQAMTVGYVGNLTERVNWPLVLKVARECTEVRFAFVGNLNEAAVCADSEGSRDWRVARATALDLPNVDYFGQVPQSEVARYYWSCAVNWMPYTVNHTFNRAASPTKIMDGIASGRPMLSTDIPECRLYPEWLTIFHSAEEAISLIRHRLAAGGQPEAHQQSLRQMDFARGQTWAVRAQVLEQWLAKL